MGFPQMEEEREVVGLEQALKLKEEGWLMISAHLPGEAQPGIVNPDLVYRMGRPKRYEDKNPRE